MIVNTPSRPCLRPQLSWALLFALAASAALWAGPVNGPPQVQIVAFFDPALGYRASLSYSTSVTETQARAELTALALALGYTKLDDLQPNKPDGTLEPFPFHTEPTGGSQIGFRMSELAFDRARGTFKLEPFISVYRAYRRLDLEFDVGDLGRGRFVYRGLADHDDARVRLHHHGEGSSHSFSIEVLDQSFRSLRLPEFAPPGGPVQVDPDSPADSGSTTAREWLKIVLAALGAGGLTFGVLYALLGRTPPRRSAPPQRPAQ